MQSRWISVAALLALAVTFPAGSAHGQPVDALQPAPARPALVFNPNTPDRCEWFFITESNINYAPMNAPNSRFMLDDSFGLMKQVGERTAVGASIDLILAGDVHYAPTVRYKRWHGRQSLDLMLGYVPGELAGPTGPILTARYSPAPRYHMQIGACRYNEDATGLYYPPGSYFPAYLVEERKPLRVFAGIGFGGIPGISMWGAQAVVLMVVAATFAGWN